MPKVKDPEDVDNMNMTPMIDVVFQLIIFFMLVTDMANQQLERLKLPTASKAIKEKFSDETLMVLNVTEKGVVKIQGKTYFTPPSKERPEEYDAKKLEDVFIARRQDKRYQELAGKDDIVKYPLLIRADRSTEWQWVQMIMQIATKEGGVTRVQMGAMQEEGK